MKNKQRKAGKPKDKSPEVFTRDDVPTGVFLEERSKKPKKHSRKDKRDNFREYYY